MCLSVYLGCHVPLDPRSIPVSGLGFEAAAWTPPPLEGFPHVYYLGRRSAGAALECTCLLAQHVTWTMSGPEVVHDESLSSESSCPFETLQSYVKQAMGAGKPVSLVCDDSGGDEQACTLQDYDQLFLHPTMITPDSFLFADPVALFPWRVFHMVVGQGT